MIRSTLANVGSCADLWGRLKSIHHALARARDTSGSVKLTEFDRERLQSLVAFLQENAVQNATAEPLSPQSLLLETRRIPNLEISFRERISEVASFRAWQASAKTGFDKKIFSLIQEVESFLGRSAQEMFPKAAPQPAFDILNDIVVALISEIEHSAM